ncbi:hypothetical protein F3Y22_tig00110299pilonHSYRG00110 [Hibiscus syriacus]|uniref:Reverse transcriptase zinc-binding domain-containing protein n=1 Tax=Hibiscus syriacus TaxID=106335 RepID=A0A6A3B7L9_HIBSY|nr:hypothetical protein F3Y22_tig00110299pilonHSYRG00110 [Hibiscus syriacus]
MSDPTAENRVTLLLKLKTLVCWERTRRHLALDARCRICNHEEEDINHILRLCPTANTLWVVLIKEEKLEQFLALGIKEWILKKLTSPFYFYKKEEVWVTLFGAILWNLWKQRNQQIFAPEVLERETILECSRPLVMETNRAIDSLGDSKTIEYIQDRSEIRWKPPPPGWLKLNSNGFVSGPNGVAACGREIRDDKGEWIMGFHKAMGTCSVLEVDNKKVWKHLQAAGQKDLESTVWYYVANIIRKDWDIQAAHTLHEGNIIANEMAKLGREGDSRTHRMVAPLGTIYNLWTQEKMVE